jgi:hypothetical protein
VEVVAQGKIRLAAGEVKSERDGRHHVLIMLHLSNIKTASESSSIRHTFTKKPSSCKQDEGFLKGTRNCLKACLTLAQTAPK